MSDAETILEWPPLESIPNSFLRLVDDACELLTKYYIEGQKNKFPAWQETLRKIINHSEFELARPPFRAGIFYRYGVALQWKVVMFDYSHDFAGAEKCWLEVIRLMPSESRLNLRSRYNIALTRTNMYRSSGDVALLDSAVEMMRNCAIDSSADLPEAALCWEGLSWALDRRFTTLGNVKDLDLCVRAAESCVQVASPDSPRKMRYTARLAGALRMRFSVYGNIADIDNSIRLYEHLRNNIPENSVDWGAFLADSVMAWRGRYVLTGQLSDLLKAHEVAKLRLETVNPMSGNYQVASNSYGIICRHLFEATGERAHIEDSIHHLRKAVGAIDELHESYPGDISDLGNSLVARYYAYHKVNDLDEAIDCYSEALRMVERGAARQPGEKLRYPLEPIITSAYNLGTALIEKYKGRSSIAIEDTIEGVLKLAYELGIRRLPGIALQSAVARGRWHEGAKRFALAAQAYDSALQAAQQLFRQQATTDDKVTRISKVKNLPQSAAFCHAQNSNYSQAVLAIEQGRAILLTESLDIQAGELDALRDSGHSHLVDSYRAALLRLEIVSGQAGYSG